MSGEEREKEKGKEREEKDIVGMLVEELRLLRMAIEAHTKALYLLATGTRRYRYRGGGYYRGWGRKRGRRYGYLKNT